MTLRTHICGSTARHSTSARTISMAATANPSPLSIRRNVVGEWDERKGNRTGNANPRIRREGCKFDPDLVLSLSKHDWV